MASYYNIETHPIIENAFIEIHTKPFDNIPFNIFENTADKFGTLTLQMANVEITKQPIFILLNIDISSSMDDTVKFGNGSDRDTNRITKMDYMIKTCKNIVEYLSKQTVDVYLTIHAFDIDVDVIVNQEKITLETKGRILEQIDDLTPNGSTDIGFALIKAGETLNEYKEAFPNHKISHIFMTDGEPNVGVINFDMLKTIVNDQYNNVFIGFGKDHNATLLRKLGDKKNAEYHVVVDEENTGFVYADTIYQLLYPAIENVTIAVNNGLIYNWKTNTWDETLNLNVLVSKVKKTFHIKTDQPENVHATIHGVVSNEYIVPQLLDVVIPLPELLVNTDDGELTKEFTDLSTFIFRQKVQEILYDLSNIETTRRNRRRHNMDILLQKRQLRSFFAKMRKFMRENNLLVDPFMLLLCDDVLVVYQNLHTSHSNMYVSARRESQGSQQCYTTPSPNYQGFDDIRFVSDNDSDDDDSFDTLDIAPPNASRHHLPLTPPFPLLRRGRAFRSNSSDSGRLDTILNDYLDEDVDREDDINYYTTRNDTITCYATENMTNTLKLFAL